MVCVTHDDKTIPSTTGKYSCDGKNPSSAISEAFWAEVRVTPNLFSEFIEITNRTGESLVYELLNTQGVVLKTGKVVEGTNSVATSELRNGIHFLRLRAADNVQKTVKLIKE